MESSLSNSGALKFKAGIEKKEVINRLGTKLGEIYLLIKKILEEDSQARIIVFTTVRHFFLCTTDFQALVFAKLIIIVLKMNDIPSLLFANSKENVLRQFKASLSLILSGLTCRR